MFALWTGIKNGTKVVGVLLVAIVIAACSAQEETENGLVAVTRGEEVPKTEIAEPKTESGTGNSGVISSDGEEGPFSSSEAASPGLSPSGGPLEPSSDEELVNWLVYTDTVYGFSIAYPQIYVILPESASPTATTPPRVHRVRWQDEARASGQYVDRFTSPSA